MATRHFQCCLFLCPYLAVAAARADETTPAARWPQFRGPSGQGAATDEAPLPIEFGPSKNVLWKTALPLGHSSPCIWDDRIFLTAGNGEERRLITICLDRRTGDILWERSVTAEKLEPLHQLNCPASSTPATDGQRVFVYFGSYGLIAYDLDGNEQWKKALAPMPGYFGLL